MKKAIIYLALQFSHYRNKGYIKKLSDYIRAGAWILSILFFAYIALFMTLLQTTPSFFEKLVDTQNSSISLVVNFGIVVLLIFENLSNKVFQYKSNPYACAAFGLTILIYVHAKNFIEGNSQDLLKWLNSEGIAYLLIVTYFIVITHIRYLAKKPNIEERTILSVKI